MDFTFCNALIFALAISVGTTLSGIWKKIRIWYIVSWAVVLILSLERTPLLMTIAAICVVFYLNSGRQKRKKLIWKSAAAFSIFIVLISVASPYLKDTGAQKFIRLAELANPFGAASIKERLWKNWGPTLETISANPFGVGIGYGSQTKASAIAARSDYWIEPHNEFLQKTLETGVMGGMAFLLLLISVFRDTIKLSHLRKSVRRFGIGFAGATVGFWLCGMVNVPFSGSSGLLYWATAGVVLAQFEHFRRAKDTTNEIAQSADTTIS
jgi:O-antigen ligase